MALYQNLPWLPSSDQFLKAMLAGSEAGQNELGAIRAGTQLALARDQARRESEPMGAAPMRMAGGIDPLTQSKIKALQSQTALQEQTVADEKSAYELAQSLASRGATAEEIFQQAGLGRFGAKPPETTRPQLFGSAEAGYFQIDPVTGQPKQLVSPIPQKESGVTMTVPNFPPDMTAGEKILAKTQGEVPMLRGTPEAIQRFQQKQSGRVRVTSPDGKTGSIPESQLDEALAAGYKVVDGVQPTTVIAPPNPLAGYGNMFGASPNFQPGPAYPEPDKTGY